MKRPVIYTRREFLAHATAAATAVVAGGGVLGACTDDTRSSRRRQGRRRHRRRGDPPTPTASAPPTTTPASESIDDAACERSDGRRSCRSPSTQPSASPVSETASTASSSVPSCPGRCRSRPAASRTPPGRSPARRHGSASSATTRRAPSSERSRRPTPTITWTVSVANTKAAWYDFDRAMDLPVAAAVRRRNLDVTGADRERLVVAAGERSISGPAAEPVALDAGRFLDEPVPLGELLTDELGRLVFLPAEGRGYSPGQAPLPSFANNDGWSDDTCDGPVLATVTIGGRTLHAEPGWVVVAPPNYGPGLARRPDHRVRLVTPGLGHLRRRRADRGRRQLPRRHLADLQPHRRHAMGQRRLPRLERVGQRRRLPGAGPARATRRSVPDERRTAPADVRAVPQPGLRHRATGRRAADVR